ncbi:MAG TPA: DUF333 domain-containing protein, partial [Methanoregula sp.]|nr:DUF333 domain-containing protein [Methanoregula sp.]
MASKSLVFLILGFFLVLGIFSAGCTQQSTTAPATTTTPTAQATTSVQAGMANPASVNCGSIGGTTEIKKNADGSEYGMCTFTNGTTCEEWALFRGEGCKAGAEPNQTGNNTMTGQTGLANPAAVNCVNIGGTVEIKDGAAGQYGMCTFKNGTTCEEWALFRGEGCKAGAEPNQTGNSTMTGQTGLANPAAVNCVNIGGTVEIKDGAAGQYGM